MFWIAGAARAVRRVAHFSELALFAAIATSCSTHSTSIAPPPQPPLPVASAPTAPSPAVPPSEPPKPRWTLDEAPEIMSIYCQAMVLRSGLDGVRLRGPITLLHPPNDFDTTFLARRGVDEATLPASIRGRRNASVTLFAGPHDLKEEFLNGRVTSTVKDVAGYGLVEGLIANSRWDGKSCVLRACTAGSRAPRTNARRLPSDERS